jgi:hypothetical protein
MDSLERRLIELNQALLKIAAGQKPTEELIMKAQEAVSGVKTSFDLGPGNDTVIINNTDDCKEGFTGSRGFTGSAGENGTGFTGSRGTKGFTGSQGLIGFTGSAGVCQCDGDCSTILVSEDYEATCNNYYIGVNSKEPVKITLPKDCEDCCEIIVKAEMGPPLGNRKITISTSDGSLIDGSDKYVIEVPYQSIRLICRDSDWYIIGTYK